MFFLNDVIYALKIHVDYCNKIQLKGNKFDQLCNKDTLYITNISFFYFLKKLRNNCSELFRGI